MQVFEDWESEIRGYCRAYPTVFASASNARQVDEDGRSYIDFFAGAGVLNFGHNNARMKRAVIDFIEADGVAHSLDMYTTVKRSFIERFVDVVLEPREMRYKLQFMGPTGTNAVEAALKLARKVTGRQDVVAFTNGFHGMTLGALACTANSYFRAAAGVSLDNVHRVNFDGYASDDALAGLRAALAGSSSGLAKPAAFIVETVQAEGGVNVASQSWLRSVQDLAREHGSLLIIDDIQVGCGRTGSYFSFDGMGLDPDIVCLAKGIGGFGTPLAMNMIKPEHDQWSPGEHTGTFRGQGISFVAGAEALSYFEDDELMRAVAEKGERTDQRLRSFAEQFGDGEFSVRGRGMIHGLDLGDGALAKQVAKTCFESGLLVGPCGPDGRVIKVIAPLTIPETDLDAGLDILGAALESVLEQA